MQKIAIIEDDPALSQMYRFKFETEGFDVQIADNGKSGLDLIEKFKPFVILLDLMMPEMNGDEMLEKLRKFHWGKNILVYILTNIGELEVPSSVHKNGAKKIILKAEMTPKQVVDIVKADLRGILG